MSAIVVITTAGNEEEANALAGELVRRRQAACVNILPVRKSVYRWKGKVCEDSEQMLVIKSTVDAYPDIETSIRDLHSYEQPEILSFNVAGGDPGFLAWLAESVGPE